MNFIAMLAVLTVANMLGVNVVAKANTTIVPTTGEHHPEAMQAQEKTAAPQSLVEAIVKMNMKTVGY